MLKIYFIRCLSILMLCLSIQYALVEVDEVLHHDIGTEHIHTVGESHSNDEAHDENHCQHCCHSHACNLGVNNSSIDLFTSTDDHFQAPVRGGKARLGPPTPPPNA